MSHIVEHLIQHSKPAERLPSHTVSQQDYEQWARGFVFESLRNQRYGQSFCNRFDIKDNILFFASTVAQADEYIKKHYIR